MNLEDSLNLLQERSDEQKYLLDGASYSIKKADEALNDSAFKSEFKWKIPATSDFFIWMMHGESRKWKIHLRYAPATKRPFIECNSRLRLKYYKYLPQFVVALVESQR